MTVNISPTRPIEDRTNPLACCVGCRFTCVPTAAADGTEPETTDPPASTDPTVEVVADGGTTWTDLTGFQRDLITAIRRIDETATIPTGRVVKEEAESMYGEAINHGRLYQNLNELVERGCIDKMIVDGRTNAYYLTDEAVCMLDETARQLVTTCDLALSATES